MTGATAIKPPHRDPFFWLILALGVALRGWMLATGRSPLDGDEYVMGLMARDISVLDHLPIYFYGQHYLGVLELPLVSFFQLLGPERWDFSIWPIRLTSAIYFGMLLWTHYRLSARFFSRGVARWAIFFLCVAPVYWLDYSSRLRHVVLMMFMGEAIALAALNLIDAWRAGERTPAKWVFALGLLTGLAWWHYQLVLIFLLAVAALLLPEASPALRWFRRNGRFDPIGILVAALFAAGLAFTSGLTLGWFASQWRHFALFVAASVALALPAVAYAISLLRAKPEDRGERLMPTLLLGGFFVGFLPALIYLFRLNEEYWIMKVSLDFYDVLGRTRNLFLLDFSYMLQFMRPNPDSINIQELTPLSYVFFVAYAIALYSFVRGLIRPPSPGDRLGRRFWLSFLIALIALHILTPRNVDFTEPRFLLPAFGFISTILALVADELVGGLFRNRAARCVTAACLVAGSIAVWAPGWHDMKPQPMSFPDGHRASSVEVANALAEHNVQRVVISESANWVLFGYELQYVTRMRVRFNANTMGDRLIGIVDESLYNGEEYALMLNYEIPEWVGLTTKATEDELRAATIAHGGFVVGRYYVIPRPGSYKARGRGDGKEPFYSKPHTAKP